MIQNVASVSSLNHRRRGSLLLRCHGNRSRNMPRPESHDAISMNPQLSRKMLCEQLELEYIMRAICPSFVFFLLLVTLYIFFLLLARPVGWIGMLHEQYTKMFELDATSLKHATTDHDAVIEFMDKFINKTYTMAAGLVDITVLDSIDPARCFDQTTGDVCANLYWYSGGNARDGRGGIDPHRLEQDFLSRMNHAPSVLDCGNPESEKYEDGGFSCINRTSDLYSLPARNASVTWGLLPEQPIILNRRKSYPFASFAILAPVVWQRRKQLTKCTDLGRMYQEDLMGAGKCRTDAPCSDKGMSKFYGTVENARTKRNQIFWIAYDSELFSCLDVQYAEKFMDKSWKPWATHKEMTKGTEAVWSRVSGELVFYKFITSMAYLQAPAPGKHYVNPSACHNSFGHCVGPDEPVGCSDPLETGSSHPMWNEFWTSGKGFYNCSLRKQWADQYLASATNERANTFLTRETSEITIASLMLTPGGETWPTILTVVSVRFIIGPMGHITADVSLNSAADVEVGIFVLGVVCLAVCGLYCLSILNRFRSFCKRGYMIGSVTWLMMDCINVTLCVTHIIWSLLYFGGRKGTRLKIQRAFELDQNSEYFKLFADIKEDNDHLSQSHVFGFYCTLTLFVRILLFTEVHPRLSMLLDVVKVSANDMLQFFTFVLLICLVLGSIGHWMFGETHAAYASGWMVFWTLTRMLTGEWNFSQDLPPSFQFALYCILCVSIIFCYVLNFLVAIIIETYTACTQATKTLRVGHNFVFDFISMLHTTVASRYNKWPTIEQVLEYCCGDAGPGSIDEDMPAVTAEEFYFMMLDPSGVNIFESLTQARAFCWHIGEKLSYHGGYPLRESSAHCLFAEGQYFGMKNAAEGENSSQRNTVHIDQDHDDITDAKSLHLFSRRSSPSSQSSRPPSPSSVPFPAFRSTAVHPPRVLRGSFSL